MLTARLGWIIAVVAASTEHHGPAADSGIRGAGPRRNYTNPAELALFAEDVCGGWRIRRRKQLAKRAQPDLAGQAGQTTRHLA